MSEPQLRAVGATLIEPSCDSVGSDDRTGRPLVFLAVLCSSGNLGQNNTATPAIEAADQTESWKVLPLPPPIEQ